MDSLDPHGRPYEDAGWDELWFGGDQSLKLAIFDAHGALVDAGDGQYRFVADNEMVVKFPRIRDEQTWIVEKVGSDLVVRIQTPEGRNWLLYQRIG